MCSSVSLWYGSYDKVMCLSWHVLDSKVVREYRLMTFEVDRVGILSVATGMLGNGKIGK